jgi:hypothetical protein
MAANPENQKPAKMSVAELEAQLVAAQAALAEKEAKIAELSRRPFSIRSIQEAVIREPDVATAKLVIMAKEAGSDMKEATIKMQVRDTLRFIALAKDAGRWLDQVPTS